MSLDKPLYPGYTHRRDLTGEKGMAENKPNHQQTYRKSQASKGFVRYEVQLPAKVKATLEAQVTEIAADYEHLYDPRRRKALARAQLFTQLTEGTQPVFTALKTQISALKAELAALTPAYFVTDEAQSTPLPHTIAQLADNPTKLKQLLAKTYAELQQAKKDAREQQRRSEQYRALYEALLDENERLQSSSSTTFDNTKNFND
jgi:hypothetical protein